jgi:integrase
MARERKGSIKTRKNGSIWARVTFTDEVGKRREMMRRAETRTEARKIIKQLLAELDHSGDRVLDGDRMTFAELAKVYAERKLIPAVYAGEGEHRRRVAGLRSHKSPQRFLRTLVENFGRKRVRSISHADIEAFKLLRLQTPRQRDGRPRSIASVNRELETLRAILRYAAREGWLLRSPFEQGAPLIEKTSEVRRERVLTHEEEARLLAACTGRRAHLRALVVCALDTAMRRGEMFALRWRDVDLPAGLIRVRATTTKTERARTPGITPRLHEALEGLKTTAPPDPDGLVFGITYTIKNGFKSACKAAGITGFRLHDCRHTAITRMIEAGLPPAAVMTISGHTQMNTFQRYVNPNADAARRGAELLAALNAKYTVLQTLATDANN